MKPKKTRIFCLLLSALMMLSLTGCGQTGPSTSGPASEETSQKAPSETSKETEQPSSAVAQASNTIHTNLWDLSYDEQDGWVYEEDDFYDDETVSKIILTIPEEGGEGTLVNLEIRVSIEDPYLFRDDLTSYGFDEYEYAVNQAYDLTQVGGVGCLRQEGNYWGSPCLRYFNRVESAGATVFMEIVGEYEDERVDKLLSGLTINLEDTGNEDGPWYWEGEPFSAEARSAMVGTFTLESQWIPFTDCIMTKEVFNHAVAAVGEEVFLLVDGELKRYDYDGASLTLAEDIPLDAVYENISADTSGNLWLGNFTAPLISWKDGTVTGSFEGPSYVAMHPSGSWGISWFSSAECDKISFSGGAMATQPMVFSEVDIISHLMVDENHIYVCGSAVDGSGHKIFVYDEAGTLQMTLAGEEGGSLGSVTFVTETSNGYLALDGNMREVVLWNKEGAFIGEVDDGDIFGTDYPWFCGGTRLADGSILAIMTDTRADKSADELVAFRLSGF